MYLGHKWQDQVSILASRLTLLIGKEIKFSFLSDTIVKAKGEYDTTPKDYPIQGFCLSSGSSCGYLWYQVEKMLNDLECIHLNHTVSDELAFTVCAYPSVMQAWYDMIYEGAVAGALIRKVGGTDALTKLYTNNSLDEIESMKDEIAKSITHFTITPKTI